MTKSDAYSNCPSSNIPDLSGLVVDDGRLLLVNPLGRGAWGVVYRAEDTIKPGRFYAVKCMMVGLMTKHQRACIAQEVSIQRLCAKTTASVVKIFKVIEDDDSGMMFVITEFCDGGDLLDRILSNVYNGRDDLIRDSFLQILDAVEACHRTSAFHRDLKPENILLKDGGKVIVLGDFGFSTRNKVTADFKMGSEPFMSPEVRGGAHAQMPVYSSARSDIWSLGVILLNLITSCIPWARASVRDPHFMRYALDDRDYLYHTFPISREANEILKTVFTLDPRGRTSIPQLRKRVVECVTFGPGRSLKPNLTIKTGHPVSKDIVYQANETEDTVPDTVTDDGPKQSKKSEPKPAKLVIVNGPPVVSEADITDVAVKGDVAVILLPSEVLKAAQIPLPTSVKEEPEVHVEAETPSLAPEPRPKSQTADMGDNFFSVDDSDSDHESESGDESDGPITPETHAVDDAAVAGAGGLENVDNLVAIDLGEAGVKVQAEGKVPLAPLQLEADENVGATFTPPEQTKIIRRPERVYYGLQPHPPTEDTHRAAMAIREILLPVIMRTR